MVIEHKEIAISKMGYAVKKAVNQAKHENRLIVGLKSIVNSLANQEELGPMMCLMAPPKAGDYATHMHEVLLKAYCLENDIYIVHLDCSDKLSQLLGAEKLESCALICAGDDYRSSGSDSEGSFLDFDDKYTKFENLLIDHCEKYWDQPTRGIVKLPEK